MSVQTIRYAEELHAGRSLIAPTVGSSMQPLLQQGKTRVVLVPLSRPLKKGDLPLYVRPSGEYVLHRVVRVEDGVCYMRGDHCYEPAERVEKAQLLGVVESVIREDGSSFPVTALGYRLYAAVWMGSYPLRFVWNALRHPRSHFRAFWAKREHR